MNIKELSKVALDAIPDLIEDLKGMTKEREDDKFSPKQRVDAAKALTGLFQLLFDRTYPRLTASQETHVSVDAAKVLAGMLPPGQARQLANELGQKLIEVESEVKDE